MSKPGVSMEQVQLLVDQLQQKYVDLTESAQQDVEQDFATIQKIFDAKKIPSYGLPIWAKRM